MPPKTDLPAAAADPKPIIVYMEKEETIEVLKDLLKDIVVVKRGKRIS